MISFTACFFNVTSSVIFLAPTWALYVIMRDSNNAQCQRSRWFTSSALSDKRYLENSRSLQSHSHGLLWISIPWNKKKSMEVSTLGGRLWSMDIMWSDNNFYSEHLSDNWLTALLPWEWLWILKAFWKLVMLIKKTLRLAGKRSPPSKAEMALSSSFSHSRESRPEKAPSLNVCESKQGNPSLTTLLVLALYIFISPRLVWKRLKFMCGADLDAGGHQDLISVTNRQALLHPPPQLFTSPPSSPCNICHRAMASSIQSGLFIAHYGRLPSQTCLAER